MKIFSFFFNFDHFKPLFSKFEVFHWIDDLFLIFLVTPFIFGYFWFKFYGVKNFSGQKFQWPKISVVKIFGDFWSTENINHRKFWPLMYDNFKPLKSDLKFSIKKHRTIIRRAWSGYPLKFTLILLIKVNWFFYVENASNSQLHILIILKKYSTLNNT